MSDVRFDHINIRTADPDGSRRFWIDGLGLREGPRPAMRLPGAWLYAEDRPVVHLIFVDTPAPAPDLTLDHVGFHAPEAGPVLARLEAAGFPPHDRRLNPDGSVERVRVREPSGVVVEILFG